MLKKIIPVILATVFLLTAQSSQGGIFGSKKSRGRDIPFGQSLMPADEKEKKILDVLEDMEKNRIAGVMNVSLEDGRLLRLLAEATCAKRVIEVGTGNGYSGIWFCLALRTTGGTLITYEIDPKQAALASENFKRAGVDGIVTIIEGDAHETVKYLNRTIDILFLDADKEGYIDYLNKLLPLVRPGGLVLTNNVNNAGQEFAKAISDDPKLETVFQGRCLSVTLRKRPLPPIEPDVGFVPTPHDVLDKMLELAEVKKDDLVYDLGCGDGRIVVAAAKKYGCRAAGYEIDPQCVKKSLENVEKNRVGHLVRIEQKDIFTLDLSEANVITLYLLPRLNLKLIPQLEKLRPGSRIVSNDFDMEGVEPDKVIKVASAESKREHNIYLWTTPLKKTKHIEIEDVFCPWCGNPRR